MQTKVNLFLERGPGSEEDERSMKEPAVEGESQQETEVSLGCVRVKDLHLTPEHTHEG